MAALHLNHQTITVRPLVAQDVKSVWRLMEDSWRVHIRMAWSSLRSRLNILPGLVVEDQVGIKGFMVIEPHSPKTGVIVAAGLRDTWSVNPFLNLLLPELEIVAQDNGLSALTCVGYETWLTEALPNYGFSPEDWIIVYERFGDGLPPDVTEEASLRTAHKQDLAEIRALDALAFDHLWRKPTFYFNEALALAGSFVVAEISGEIIGYEWCEMYEKRGHLTRLATHPNYQGRGIGAQLLRRAILDALAKGVNLITLNTQETNTRSQELYTRFGFVSTRQRLPVLWKSLPE